MTVREWFRGMRHADNIGERELLALALAPPDTLPRLRAFTFRGIKVYGDVQEAERDLTLADTRRGWLGLLD